MRSIANHVGWTQVHLLFTKYNNSKPVLVSLLDQAKLPSTKMLK